MDRAQLLAQAMAQTTPDWYRKYQSFKGSQWSPTTLSPRQEQQFQNWLMGTNWFSEMKDLIAKEDGIPLADLDNPRVFQMLMENPDYDYRGAWLDQAKMSRDPYDNRIHWPSRTSSGMMLKAPHHPTTWKEFFQSGTGINPDELGFSDPDAALQWEMGK